MIVNIRGTSGSGKSTIVRQIMELYETRMPFRLPREFPARKRPLGYSLNRPNDCGLIVLGHYETACGGCDTLPTLDLIFDLARRADALQQDVLFEGLLISAEVNRTQALHSDGLPLLVVGLEVSLEDCLASVNARRRLKNPDAPDVNRKNTVSKWRGTRRSMVRLDVAGVHTEWCGRGDALDRVREAFRL